MSRPIDPGIVTELEVVASPALRPDGRTIAYVRQGVEPGTLRRWSFIERAPFPEGDDESATVRRLTQGPLDSAPLWSPDGGSLAFLRSAREPGGTVGPPQLWLLPADGGEACQLTDLAGAVRSITWLPDGSSLVIAAEVDPDQPGPDADPEIPTVRRVNHIYYRADGIGWRGDTHRQLFRVDAREGGVRQLTSDDYDCYFPAPSPDGRLVAFASGDRSGERERRTPGKLELCVVPTGGGTVERLVTGLSGLGPITWSPDGRRLAYVSGGDEPSYSQSYLWTLDHQPEARPVCLSPDRLQPTGGGPPLTEPPPLSWRAGEITFAAERRGSSGLYRIAEAGGEVTVLHEADELSSGLSLSADAQRGATVASTVDRPGEVMTLDLDRGTGQRLTRVSDGYLTTHPPAATERFTLRRADLEIECWLTFPLDFDPQRSYPLVLEVHGGPNGFFGNGWMPLHQMLAGAGYLVLATNPRGSSTYGQDFVSRVFGDWGGEDYLDQMAAVDQVLERGYVDADRLAIHGYSYGGFMTSWTIGHTTRFRSAIVAAPVTNLVSMYGQTDIAVQFGEQQWGGTPWERADAYVRHSPITYAPRVETPVLLLHGEADIRCPISQSEEYYTVLKRLGKPVEFVRFPGGFHGFVRSGHPAMVRAYHEHVLEWFGRTL